MNGIYDYEGNSLTSGSAGYNTLPTYELSEQIVIQVEVGDSEMPWEAAIDFTSPYLTLNRQLAKQAGIHLDMPEEKLKARIQGVQMYGRIYPVDLILLADFGDSIKRPVLAFVPEAKSYDPSPLPPIILGFSGCLDRFYLACDPIDRVVHFG